MLPACFLLTYYVVFIRFVHLSRIFEIARPTGALWGDDYDECIKKSNIFRVHILLKIIGSYGNSSFRLTSYLMTITKKRPLVAEFKDCEHCDA